MSNVWPNTQFSWDAEHVSESESEAELSISMSSDSDCIVLSSDTDSDTMAKEYAKKYSYTPEPLFVSGPIVDDSPEPNAPPKCSPLTITYLCTGPQPAEAVRNDRRTCGLTVTVRQRRRATRSTRILAANPQVRTYSIRDSQLDSMHTKYFNFTRKALSMDIIDKMKRFVFDFGVSQQTKIIDGSTHNASSGERLKTFQNCHKDIKQSVLTLAESGLFYDGNGNNDSMVCYCCGTKFTKWKYKMNPWAQHALRSAECPLVLLYKGKYFVDCVLEASAYMKSCTIQAFQRIYYDVFSALDLYVLANTLGDSLFQRRHLILDAMVSASMKKTFPDLIGPVTVDLDKVPLPMNITCKICFKEKMEVLFIPCGHIISCVQCAVTLTECSVCRESFNSSTYALRIFIVEEDNNDNGDSESSDVSYGNVLCRVCYRESIDVVFVPCRHVHTCYKCAITSDNCPICLEPFLGLIQAFI